MRKYVELGYFEIEEFDKIKYFDFMSENVEVMVKILVSLGMEKFLINVLIKSSSVNLSIIVEIFKVLYISLIFIENLSDIVKIDMNFNEILDKFERVESFLFLESEKKYDEMDTSDGFEYKD